ncbi:MAG: apolipoprotein N-acyltransferase [Bacteroidales bacterium]
MTKKEKKFKLILFILFAILISVPFLVPHTAPLSLISFSPLLLAESFFKGKMAWINFYLPFLIWNLATTYWIYNATVAGAAAAVIANALQMSLIFMLFRWFKKRTNEKLGYMFLIIAWLAWEHFYFDAEISWPWLTLGNTLATSHYLAQWYEYTGTLGGSLWILLVNVVLFRIMRDRNMFARFGVMPQSLTLTGKSIKIRTALAVLLIVVPITISLSKYYTYKEVGERKQVVVLQPNIDPYNDKFAGMSQAQQDEILLTLAKNSSELSTDLIVAPETFTSGVSENAPMSHETSVKLVDFLKSRPNTDLLFGATTYLVYGLKDKPTYTARQSDYGWYDVFNTAIYTDSSANFKFYHKSKLVVLVEYLPYPQFLDFINSFAIDLGGATGSYGTQKERDVFKSSNSNIVVGAAICYESIYGDYYREYVQKGANLMTIITNDGWWGNTPGYNQHLRYASLRAIETRRDIARSANTGISAFINQKGDIVSQTKWWQPAYLKGEVTINEKITVFVKYGDYIGRIATFALILFIGLIILVIIRKTPFK